MNSAAIPDLIQTARTILRAFYGSYQASAAVPEGLRELLDELFDRLHAYAVLLMEDDNADLANHISKVDPCLADIGEQLGKLNRKIARMDVPAIQQVFALMDESDRQCLRTEIAGYIDSGVLPSPNQSAEEVFAGGSDWRSESDALEQEMQPTEGKTEPDGWELQILRAILAVVE